MNADILANFMQYLKAHGYKSLTSYYKAALIFLKFMHSHHLTFQDLCYGDFLHFINTRFNSGKKLPGIKLTVAYLRVFVDYLIREKLVAFNYNFLKDFVLNLREHTPFPKTIPTSAQLNRLKELFATDTFRHHLMFHAIFELLLQTGARYEEIKKLTNRNIYLDTQQIFIPQTKQSKQELYTIPDTSWEIFLKFYKPSSGQMNIFDFNVPYEPELDRYIFCFTNKKSPVSYPPFALVLKELASQAGIDNMTIHTIRAIRCTAVARKFGLEHAKRAIRVTSDKTALKYIFVTEEEIEEFFNDHPLDQYAWWKL